MTQLSVALMLRLRALPRLLVAACALVLLLVALMAPAPFAISAIIVLLAFVAWLASLSWPRLDPAGRLVRVVVIAALAGVLVLRLS